MANIRKRGNKFQVQVRRTGSQSYTKTFERLTEAKAWARTQEVSIDRREAGIHKPITTPLRHFLTRYLEEITPSKKSCASESRRISRLLKDPISNKRVCDLTPSVLASFRDLRLKNGRRAASYDLQIIRHTLNIARLEWGFTFKENPVDLIRMPSPSKPRDRRFRNDEYERLLKFSSNSRSYFLKPLIIIAVETGMRLGELLNMRWENFDREIKILRLIDTKNGCNRIVPLSERALITIESLPESSERIIPVTYAAVKSAWKRLCKRAGIVDLHFHDLRHEATSRFFEMNLTIPEVATITGHKTQTMLLRYAHADFTVLQKKLMLNHEESRSSTPEIERIF